MAFQLSPGVRVVETDVSAIVPAVSSSVGAYAGVFAWGPVLDPVTISSENTLVQRFGKPVDANAQSFFTAANFLSYTNNLLTVRVDTDGSFNAVTAKTGTVSDITITTAGTGYPAAPTLTVDEPPAGGVRAVLTCTINPSTGGIAAVTIVTPGTGYDPLNPPAITLSGATTLGTVAVLDAVVTETSIKIKNYDEYTTTYASGAGVVGSWAAKYPGSLGNSLTVTMADADSWDSWSASYQAEFDSAPDTTDYATSVNGSNDEMHILVIDTNGKWSGTAGTILEKFAYVSKASDAVKADGANNYYKDVLNTTSKYIWWMDHPTSVGTGDDWGSAAANLTFAGLTAPVEDDLYGGEDDFAATDGQKMDGFAIFANDELYDISLIPVANNYYKDVLNTTSKYIWWMDHPTSVGTGDDWGSAAANLTFAGLTAPVEDDLYGGEDDFAATDGQKMDGFAIFANDELYDISLIPVGKASSTVAEYVINNVVEVRKDCMAFISPEDDATGDIIIGSSSENVDKVVAYRDALPSSSYAVLDSGYKYQYDRWNDKYRWVPLNGDIAGLCARTDYTNDPWFSPGGLNRGQVKNVVKLALSPNKTDRDTLYKAGVNPVVGFPGQGVVLYGDKTLLAKPSAFDRINVRRLFIVLEKAIATAAKYQLFEFNDSFTRAQFKNLVEPFLRDVQGRRGLTDFRVKCDDTNNTGEVIDRNEFIADIFIKPNRSINFITLNFVAARSSVNFSEIGG